MARKTSSVPGHLRRKVPSALLGFVDGRTFMVIFGLGLALFMIYGPVVGPPDHNGWRYLLAPLIGPWLPASYYLLRPVRPYSGYRGRWQTTSGLIGKDAADADAARLSALFQSGDARRHMVLTALAMSAILFVPLAAATLVLGDAMTWGLSSSWLPLGGLGAAIGCSIAFFAETIHWGVTTWGGDSFPPSASRDANPR